MSPDSDNSKRQKLSPSKDETFEKLRPLTQSSPLPSSDDPKYTVAVDVVEVTGQKENTNMATALGASPGESKRNNVISPRPKGRENSKNTLCRNIGIYGHCRYENEGCAFNHDQTILKSNSSSMENRLVLSMLLWGYIE